MANQFELELRHNFPPEIQRGIVTRKVTKTYVPFPLGQFSQPEEEDYKMLVTCPYCKIKAPIIIQSKINHDRDSKRVKRRFLVIIMVVIATFFQIGIASAIILFIIGLVWMLWGTESLIDFDDEFNANNRFVYRKREHEIEWNWVL
ncbi:MAG: hypothetical protein ACW98K_06125 [Candidatus Kariarchaeaceae archaeon]|jgi:hypothetical protein